MAGTAAFTWLVNSGSPGRERKLETKSKLTEHPPSLSLSMFISLALHLPRFVHPSPSLVLALATGYVPCSVISRCFTSADISLGHYVHVYAHIRLYAFCPNTSQKRLPKTRSEETFPYNFVYLYNSIHIYIYIYEIYLFKFNYFLYAFKKFVHACMLFLIAVSVIKIFHAF